MVEILASSGLGLGLDGEARGAVGGRSYYGWWWYKWVCATGGVVVVDGSACLGWYDQESGGYRRSYFEEMKAETCSVMVVVKNGNLFIYLERCIPES